MIYNMVAEARWDLYSSEIYTLGMCHNAQAMFGALITRQ